MSKKRPLDAVDVAILKALQQDASMTNQAIGELVGLTPGPTHSRIKRMKEEGIIKGIHADLDWKALGYDIFCVMEVEGRGGEGRACRTCVDSGPQPLERMPAVDPTNDREVTFRMWAVTDSHKTMLSIMGKLWKPTTDLWTFKSRTSRCCHATLEW